MCDFSFTNTTTTTSSSSSDDELNFMELFHERLLAQIEI